MTHQDRKMKDKMTIQDILEELLNTGIEGTFRPNVYAIRKIAQAKKKIEKKFEEWIGEDKPCSTPNIRPAEYVTHDMALDAEDRSLEGQLYRQEEAEQCGGCLECIQNQAKQEIRNRVKKGIK
jgi:hypothetical protein